jgi:hypothetical protein
MSSCFTPLKDEVFTPAPFVSLYFVPIVFNGIVFFIAQSQKRIKPLAKKENRVVVKKV